MNRTANHPAAVVAEVLLPPGLQPVAYTEAAGQADAHVRAAHRRPVEVRPETVGFLIAVVRVTGAQVEGEIPFLQRCLSA